MPNEQATARNLQSISSLSLAIQRLANRATSVRQHVEGLYSTSMSHLFPRSISIWARLQLRHEQVQQARHRKFIDRKAAELRDLLGSEYFVGFIFDGETSLLATGNFPESDHFALILEWLGSRRAEVFSGIALDVGAHVGFHSCLFSNYFRHVVSFEAHPLIYQVLRFNTNAFLGLGSMAGEELEMPSSSRRLPTRGESIKIFQLALTNFDGTTKVFVNKKNNLGATSLIPNHQNTYRHEFDVQCSKLDSIALPGNVSFLKLDIENSEYEFLLGARQTILKDKPIIVMEDWESGNGVTSRAVNLLIEFGYSEFLEPSILPTKQSLLTRPIASLRKLIQSGFQVDLSPINFLSPKQGYQLMVCLPERREK